MSRQLNFLFLIFFLLLSSTLRVKSVKLKEFSQVDEFIKNMVKQSDANSENWYALAQTSVSDEEALKHSRENEKKPVIIQDEIEFTVTNNVTQEMVNKVLEMEKTERTAKHIKKNGIYGKKSGNNKTPAIKNEISNEVRDIISNEILKQNIATKKLKKKEANEDNIVDILSVFV